jgi:hypothetical protein
MLFATPPNTPTTPAGGIDLPAVTIFVSPPAIFWTTLGLGNSRAELSEILAIVNAPVGMGYVFSSRDRLARMLQPCLRLAYRLLLNPRRSRVNFENPDDPVYFVENGVVHRPIAASSPSDCSRP